MSGHDPCIANLPGVAYACCGHGAEPGYIHFYNGRVIYFAPLSVKQRAMSPNGDYNVCGEDQLIAEFGFGEEEEPP